MKVWEVTLMTNINGTQINNGSFIDKDIEGVANGMLREMAPDSSDYYIIKCIEIAEDEYEKLPEFTGF